MGNLLWRSLWRTHGADFSWSDKYSDKLRDEIGSRNPSGSVKPVILMFGPTGHGKSTYINSISSINKGRKVNVASAARHASHVTEVYRTYKIEGGCLGNAVFADVEGIVEKNDNESLIKNVLKIIDGHVKSGFNWSKDKAEGPNPDIADKVHCVIFVFDCRYVKDLNTTYSAGVMGLMTELYRKDIPRIVVLTHADCVWDSDIKNIYRDKKVKEKVDFIMEFFGVPLENIHPVQNFGETKDAELNKIQSIPLLLAFQQALNFACDTIDKWNIEK